MPIAAVGGREGPGNTFQGKAGLDVAVFGDIHRIIESNEFKVDDLNINNKRGCNQQKANPKNITVLAASLVMVNINDHGSKAVLLVTAQ